LWERLAELLDDEARQANSRNTNWDDLKGSECKSCHREVQYRLIDGRCWSCARKKTEEASEVTQRLLQLQRRYPGLVSMKTLRKVRGQLRT
jgi:methionyl-tRNA synthetase